MQRGFLISFEGGEGCGKSTQIKLLSKYLQDKGIECVVSKEPGGTELAEEIRCMLLHSKAEISSRAEFLLFSASRAEIMDKVVLPALNNGKIVLLDRFYDSSFAYQGFAGGLKLEDIQAITSFAIGGKYAETDITFLLDNSFEEGLKRKQKDIKLQKLDRMELKGKEYHEKVRNGFLSLAKNSNGRIQIIDASKSTEKVFQEIIKFFEAKYKENKGS